MRQEGNEKPTKQEDIEKAIKSPADAVGAWVEINVGQKGTRSVKKIESMILTTKGHYKFDKALDIALDKMFSKIDKTKEFARKAVLTRTQKKAAANAKVILDKLEALDKHLATGDKETKDATSDEDTGSSGGSGTSSKFVGGVGIATAVLGALPSVLNGLQAVWKLFLADVESTVFDYPQAPDRLRIGLENRGYQPYLANPEEAVNTLRNLNASLMKTWPNEQDQKKADEAKEFLDSIDKPMFLAGFAAWKFLQTATGKEHMEVELSGQVQESTVTRTFGGQSYKVGAYVLVRFRAIASDGKIVETGKVYVEPRRGWFRKWRVRSTFSTTKKTP